jgi:hypothetical protein
MKSLSFTSFEEKWLKKVLRAEITALEEWEGSESDPLTAFERNELKMLRKLVERISEKRL